LRPGCHFHIFLGVQGMVCVVFHSLHVFTRDFAVHLLNPAVLNFIAVAVVFFSGLFGRYLYSFLPRTMGGEQMAARDVEAELAKLGTLPAEVQPLLPTGPAPRTLAGLIGADRQTRRSLRKLGTLSVADDARALVVRRLRLQSRLHARQRPRKSSSGGSSSTARSPPSCTCCRRLHVVLSYMYAMSFASE